MGDKLAGFLDRRRQKSLTRAKQSLSGEATALKTWLRCSWVEQLTPKINNLAILLHPKQASPWTAPPRPPPRARPLRLLLKLQDFPSLSHRNHILVCRGPRPATDLAQLAHRPISGQQGPAAYAIPSSVHLRRPPWVKPCMEVAKLEAAEENRSWEKTGDLKSSLCPCSVGSTSLRHYGL